MVLRGRGGGPPVLVSSLARGVRVGIQRASLEYRVDRAAQRRHDVPDHVKTYPPSTVLVSHGFRALREPPSETSKVLPEAAPRVFLPAHTMYSWVHFVSRLHSWRLQAALLHDAFLDARCHESDLEDALLCVLYCVVWRK